MKPPLAPPQSLLPGKHERTVFVNVLLLLGLPVTAYLAHLHAIAGKEDVNLPGEALMDLLVCVALSFAGVLAWRRMLQRESRRARVERARATLARLGTSVAGMLRARPLAALWLAALAGVVVSCYPVVFGGKSFVSSSAVQSLFYGSPPSLPQGGNELFEDAHGSDTGAMMWQTLPYSVIEYRAIFESGELPVWNRYNSGGLTLIGQGQSMLGDPLNWLVVLAGGGTWAWDLKFLAARLLFAVGVGRCVRAATGRLGAALILTFTACFLGFFSYRVNHPATFSVAYAPWILLAWLRIVRDGPGDLVDPAIGGARRALRWVGLLLLACWMELSSGTVKESTMLLVFLNGTGGLILVLDDRRSWRWKRLALAGLGWAFTGFLLVSAPLWRTLLESLAHAWNNYEKAPVWQLQPGTFIGLFDDIFYRQFNGDERMFDPSLSFVVLLGLAFALTSARTLARRHRVFLALGLGTLLPFALVFGVVPPSWLRAVPFLGKLLHVDNTFTCVLMVPLLVLAGFGLERCRERFGARDWAWDYAAAAAVPLLLLALYLGTVQAGQQSDFSPLPLQRGELPLSAFFKGYVCLLLAALLALPLLVWWWRRAGAGAAPGIVPWIVLCLGTLLWRGGLHERAVVGWNTYVMHLGPRDELRVRSPGVDRLLAANRVEPGRCLGFNNNPMPGYAALLGLETPSGPDALQNPRFHALVVASHTPFFWGWLAATTRGITATPMRRFYDLLNVRYYSDRPAPGTAAPADVPGLRTLGRYTDLDLYESPTAWPRAFFTDALVPSSGNADLLRTLAGSDGRPFAAVSPTELRTRPDATACAQLLRQPGGDAARAVVPATGYRLTSRTTTFHLHAPGPGVAVLMEGYQLPENAQAFLDGTPVPHLRLNEAFMGVRVPGAGEHEVRVVYGPRDLPMLLGASTLGLVLLGGTAGWVRRSGRRSGTAAGGTPPPARLPPGLSTDGNAASEKRRQPEVAVPV